MCPEIFRRPEAACAPRRSGPRRRTRPQLTTFPHLSAPERAPGTTSPKKLPAAGTGLAGGFSFPNTSPRGSHGVHVGGMGSRQGDGLTSGSRAEREPGANSPPARRKIPNPFQSSWFWSEPPAGVVPAAGSCDVDVVPLCGAAVQLCPASAAGALADKKELRRAEANRSPKGA